MESFPIQVITFSVLDLYKQLPAGASPEVSGSFLMGRDKVGIPIRRLVEDKVARLYRPTTTVLNFAEIEDISASVAEELGPLLASFVSTRSHLNTELYLVYANLSADVRLGLDDEFNRQGQVAIAVEFDPNEPEIGFSEAKLLGPALSAPLQDIVYRCYKYGEATSADLANDSLAATSKKLTELCDRYPALLYRTKVTGTAGPRSWQYVYYPVIPPKEILPSSTGSSK